MGLFFVSSVSKENPFLKKTQNLKILKCKNFELRWPNSVDKGANEHFSAPVTHSLFLVPC